MTESIATLSSRIARKPSKQLAQELIRELYRNPSLEDADRERLAALYCHFTPPQPKVAKTDWQWVALAMGKKDIRFYLNYVHVDERRIVATDGHRLHTIPNTENLAPGFYLANGDRVEDPSFAKYPDIDRAIPRGDSRTETRVTLTSLEVRQVSRGVYCYVIPLEQGSAGLDKRYLDAVVNGAKEATLLLGGSNDAVRIDYGARTAVIMPVRQ